MLRARFPLGPRFRAAGGGACRIVHPTGTRGILSLMVDFKSLYINDLETSGQSLVVALDVYAQNRPPDLHLVPVHGENPTALLAQGLGIARTDRTAKQAVRTHAVAVSHLPSDGRQRDREILLDD